MFTIIERILVLTAAILITMALFTIVKDSGKAQEGIKQHLLGK